MAELKKWEKLLIKVCKCVLNEDKCPCVLDKECEEFINRHDRLLPLDYEEVVLNGEGLDQ